MAKQKLYTTEELINKALDSIRKEINNKITNVNKKYRTRIKYTTNDEILNRITNGNNPEQTLKALHLVGYIIEKTYAHQLEEYKLNKAYGNEDKHPMEKQPEQLSLKEQLTPNDKPVVYTARELYELGTEFQDNYIFDWANKDTIHKHPTAWFEIADNSKHKPEQEYTVRISNNKNSRLVTYTIAPIRKEVK